MKTIGKLITVIFPIFTWYAFSNVISGMENVALFMAWMTIIVWIFSASVGEVREKVVANLKEKGFSTPKMLAFPCDIAVVLIFVYFGAIVTAVFYLFAMLAEESIRQEVEEEKE